ncbi:hypothetical protein BJV82DRAFT_617179 [Fennellomyces sp. T-0311]|nr:hypothetical protein BJV82DRAFT_617179 [Fennellomyces sp. T-0311]
MFFSSAASTLVLIYIIASTASTNDRRSWYVLGDSSQQKIIMQYTAPYCKPIMYATQLRSVQRKLSSQLST